MFLGADARWSSNWYMRLLKGNPVRRSISAPSVVSAQTFVALAWKNDVELAFKQSTCVF